MLLFKGVPFPDITWPQVLIPVPYYYILELPSLNTFPAPNTSIQFLAAGTPCQPNFTYPFFSQSLTIVPVVELQHSTLYKQGWICAGFHHKSSRNSSTLTWMLKWDSWTWPECPFTVVRYRHSPFVTELWQVDLLTSQCFHVSSMSSSVSQPPPATLPPKIQNYCPQIFPFSQFHSPAFGTPFIMTLCPHNSFGSAQSKLH